MCQHMQVKIKIFITIFLFLATNTITYKITTEKTNFKLFLYDIGFSFNILKMLDNEKSHSAKLFLAYDISRLFYEAGQKHDVEAFAPACKYLTTENLNILDKYYNGKDDKIVKSGKEKIIKMCKNKGSD